MSMSESLIGATINAAYSLGLSETHGSVEKGKHADLLIVNAPKYVSLMKLLFSDLSGQENI